MPVACHEVSDALEHLAAWETSAESDDEVAGQQKGKLTDRKEWENSDSWEILSGNFPMKTP